MNASRLSRMLRLGFLQAALSCSLLGQDRDPKEVLPSRVRVSGAARLQSARGSADSTSTNKPPLQLRNASRHIHGGIRVPTIIAVADANQFSFVPPRGWRVQSAGNEKRIRLVQTANQALISVEIREYSPGGIGTLRLEPEALRPELQRRYSGAIISDEFTASALDSTGPAFDLTWSTGTSRLKAARVAFIPFAGGHLEFSLVAPEAAISRAYYDLNRLLLSFRWAPLNETLELQPVVPE